jgi:antitoxin (DNA-binding transcriptional repressor) of toxin-antitoxin stability system
MEQIGAYEAKTHLAGLLDRVTQGESFLLTRHGQVVALLTQPSGRERRPTEEVIRELQRFSEGIRLDGISLRSLIEEGRK